MNQRILLFIVIFLGFLIVVGTTVVITTVIERSGKVEFFSTNEVEQYHSFCGNIKLVEVLNLGENRISIKCGNQKLVIFDFKKNAVIHVID